MDNFLDFVSSEEPKPNYQFHYFTYLNKDDPTAQAKLGLRKLSSNDFEDGAMYMSLQNADFFEPYDTVKIGPGNIVPRLSGWRKVDLLRAIKKSGLYQPREGYKAEVIGNTVRKIYKSTGQPRSNLITYYNGLVSYASKEIAEIEAFNFANSIMWRQIGIDKDGRIPLLNTGTVKSVYIHNIYRRIYGTIYTVAWNDMCNSDKLNSFTDAKLKDIASLYFKINSAGDKQELCKLISDKQAQMLPEIMSNNNKSTWLKYVQSNY